MNREFLKFYNQELSILREQAAEFAEEYPGVAERLGGLLEDNIDPMIGGLLEGAAFLAARVQLKLKHRRLHHQPDRPVGSALSCADAVIRAR
jgi:type VI secretion system protein ImpG